MDTQSFTGEVLKTLDPDEPFVKSTITGYLEGEANKQWMSMAKTSPKMPEKCIKRARTLCGKLVRE